MHFKLRMSASERIEVHYTNGHPHTNAASNESSLYTSRHSGAAADAPDAADDRSTPEVDERHPLLGVLGHLEHSTLRARRAFKPRKQDEPSAYEPSVWRLLLVVVLYAVLLWLYCF